MVDAFAGVPYLMTAEEALDLLKVMASNDHQLPFDKGPENKGVYELDTLNAILVNNATLQQQVTNLSKQLEKMQMNPVVVAQEPTT